ncbi:MAG: hypothetical protein FWG04_05140 [Desulfovibrionaceae bacterium]|nr:hypothetical protein [Desulfovibrionaceae bacterium]
MSQTNECECGKSLVKVPVRGMRIAVDQEALSDICGSAGEGIDFSPEEQWTGKLWLDGKKIYQKTIDCGALPNNDTKTVPLNIPGLDKILDYRGIAISPAMAIILPYPQQPPNAIDCFINTQNMLVNIVTHSNASAVFTVSYLTILYTCIDR